MREATNGDLIIVPGILLGKRKSDSTPVKSNTGQHPDGDRDARRATALRANLRKRKAQQNARADETEQDAK